MSNDLKIKIFDFINRNDLYSRKDGSKKIREHFGDDGYRYYQDLWKRGCLRVNEWSCLDFTGKGWDEERSIKGRDKPKLEVDVFVMFTPLCKIECGHFETFFEKHGHGNSQSCIHHGGVREDIDLDRVSGVPEGCPHFPQEIIKRNKRILDFLQAFGTLCYKYTGRYEGAYQKVINNV